MSSVQKVNFTGAPVGKMVNIAKNFGEAERIALKIDLEKDVEKYLPKSVAAFKRTSKKLMGEIPNIIITAVGTALIAPIFIKWNPLSKTDEETRTYSALRQPISAVLAVITQVGISKPVEKYITKLSNTGFFDNEKLNKTAFQDVAYLESLYKKAKPGISKEELKKLVNTKRLEQAQAIFESIYKENTIKYFRNNELVNLSKEKFTQIFKNMTKDLTKDFDENIERVAKEKPAFKRVRGEYYRTNANEARKHLDEIQDFIKNSPDKITTDKFLENKIKGLQSQNANKELIKIVNDIKHRDGTIGITEKIKEMQSSCTFFESLSSKEEVFEKVQERINAKVKILTEKKAIVEEILEKFKAGQTISELKTRMKDLPEINFVEKLVTKYTDNIEGSLKGMKNISSVVLSVAILPLTAWLLNQLYPVIMDTIFPKLSKTKHSKEKGKLIKAVEVKK